MSTELPSFVPSSGRKRPTRADVKKVNGETHHPDSPGIPRLSVEQRAISSSASGSDSKDQVLQRPVIRLRERPRVSGIAADDAEPQAWRIGSESADEQMPKRSLLPTTADQPAENLPPSLLPDANIAWDETQLQASIGKQRIPLLILRIARCRSVASSLMLHVLRNLANVACPQPRLLFNAFNRGANQRTPSLRKRRFVTL